MPVRNNYYVVDDVDALDTKSFADSVYIFTKTLSPREFSPPEEIQLLKKVGLDFFHYLKKTLNNIPLDDSRRRILTARLNRLLQQGCFTVYRKLERDVAQAIINDVNANGTALKAQFETAEDKEIFLQRIDDLRTLLNSMPAHTDIKMKTGNKKESKNKNRPPSPIHLHLGKLQETAFEHIMMHQYALAVDTYTRAVEFAKKNLAGETGQQIILRDLTCLLANAYHNLGLNKLEQNDMKSAIMNLNSAVVTLQSISPELLTRRIKKLSHDYSYKYADTALLYPHTSADAVSVITLACHRDTDRQSPQQLELVRHLVNAVSARCRIAFLNKSYDNLEHDIASAMHLNFIEFEKYNDEEEVLAENRLLQLEIVIQFNQAHRYLPHDQDNALSLYLDALLKSLELNDAYTEQHIQISDYILQKLNPADLETLYQKAESLTLTRPDLSQDVRFVKFMFQLNYKLAYLCHQYKHHENAINFLKDAQSHLHMLRYLDNSIPTKKIDAHLLRSLGKLYYQHSKTAVNAHYLLRLYFAHMAISFFKHIVLEQAKSSDRVDQQKIIHSIQVMLNQILEQVNSDGHFDQALEYIRQLQFDLKDKALNDHYNYSRTQLLIQKGYKVYNEHRFEDALHCFGEAEALCHQITSMPAIDSVELHKSIRLLQSEALLEQQKMLPDDSARRLQLLLRAFRVFTKIGIDKLPPCHLTRFHALRVDLAVFRLENLKRIDQSVALFKTVYHAQPTLFNSSERVFSATLKPLILSLQNDKTLDNLLSVKDDIIDFIALHKNTHADALDHLMTIVTNEIDAVRKTAAGDRNDLDRRRPAGLRITIAPKM